MKQTTITLFLILLTITTVLLIWQWNTYSNEKNSQSEVEQVQQHLTVESKEKELSITQTITGLSNQEEYRILKPDSLFRWECKDRTGEYCSSSDESPETFLANNGELNFQYIIPIQNQSAFLLTEWISSISNVEVVKTTIDIVERERRDSTWIAGIPQTGFKKLSFIDFYTFKGEASLPALYWQQASVFKNDGNQFVSFFTKQPGSDESVLQNLKHVNLKGYTSIILTEDHKPASGNGIWIVSSQEQIKDLKEQLVYSFFETKFSPLSSDEKWILELLTAETLEKPTTGQKSTAVQKELASKLTDTERQSWLKIILEGGLLSFQKLDDALGSVKELKTTFFTKNRNEKSQWMSLYFVDPRNIIINGKVIENLNVVSRGDEFLFPFISTMKELGFLVTSNEDESEIVLLDGKNSYTFYLNQPFFHHDEEKFGLLDQPFVVDNGIIYIKHEPMQSIFNVIIEEEKNLIKLGFLK